MDHPSSARRGPAPPHDWEYMVGSIMINARNTAGSAVHFSRRARLLVPVKTDGRAPKLRITNSVLALEKLPMIGGHHATKMWSLIGACSDNLLLVFDASADTGVLGEVPPCFTVVTGEAASSRGGTRNRPAKSWNCSRTVVTSAWSPLTSTVAGNICAL